MKKLRVIVGPTGVGKTAFAIEEAEKFGCPVINADSRQIYRDLPIGTAAPTLEEQSAVRHYFVGTHALNESYNAGQYERDCLNLLDKLFQDYDTIVMSGGSFLYVDAVCNGLDEIPSVPEAIRNEVRQLFLSDGIRALQEEVQRIDPEYYAEVDTENPQRLMHCLEVSRTIGAPYSSLRTHTQKKRSFEIEKTGLIRPRDILYNRINLRVLEMMKLGLLDEAVRAFSLAGIDPKTARVEDLPNSLNTVGYKELFMHLQGALTMEEAVALIQQNSRHFAKRQITWLRRDQSINWITL